MHFNFKRLKTCFPLSQIGTPQFRMWLVSKINSGQFFCWPIIWEQSIFRFEFGDKFPPLLIIAFSHLAFFCVADIYLRKLAKDVENFVSEGTSRRYRRQLFRLCVIRNTLFIFVIYQLYSDIFVRAHVYVYVCNIWRMSNQCLTN